MPDRSLPVGVQLEAALRLLVERSKILKVQEIKIATLEADLSVMKLSLQEKTNTLIAKDSELMDYQLGEANQHVLVSKESETLGVRAMKISQEREAELIRIAEDTVSSLKRQLDSKDELIEKYRRMVKELRSENSDQKNEEQVQIRQKIEEINQLTEDYVGKLRVSKERKGNVEDKSGLLQDLEKLLEAKTSEISSLQAVIQLHHQDLDLERSKFSQQVQELQDLIKEKENEIQEKVFLFLKFLI